MAYGGRPTQEARERTVLNDLRKRFVLSADVDAAGQQLPPDGTGTPDATVLDLQQRVEPLVFTKVITAAVLGANMNDYAPADFAHASLLRVSASVPVSISGFAADGHGHVKMLANIGAANNITLVHENAGSVAGNRFNLKSATNVTLLPGMVVWLVYDTVSLRWRVAGS
jgi:hypothetical protein